MALPYLLGYRSNSSASLDLRLTEGTSRSLSYVQPWFCSWSPVWGFCIRASLSLRFGEQAILTCSIGLSRRKNALALLWVCVFSNAVIIFQWYFWGYSLAFSSTATNGFIGELALGFKNLLLFTVVIRQPPPFRLATCPSGSFPRFPSHSGSTLLLLPA